MSNTLSRVAAIRKKLNAERSIFIHKMTPSILRVPVALVDGTNEYTVDLSAMADNFAPTSNDEIRMDRDCQYVLVSYRAHLLSGITVTNDVLQTLGQPRVMAQAVADGDATKALFTNGEFDLVLEDGLTYEQCNRFVSTHPSENDGFVDFSGITVLYGDKKANITFTLPDTVVTTGLAAGDKVVELELEVIKIKGHCGSLGTQGPAQCAASCNCPGENTQSTVTTAVGLSLRA